MRTRILRRLCVAVIGALLSATVEGPVQEERIVVMCGADGAPGPTLANVDLREGTAGRSDPSHHPCPAAADPSRVSAEGCHHPVASVCASHDLTCADFRPDSRQPLNSAGGRFSSYTRILYGNIVSTAESRQPLRRSHR